MQEVPPRLRSHRFALAASLLCIGELLLFWPGLINLDALWVYDQAVTNDFNDWHPPIMGRLWQPFIAIGWTGTGPLFLLQSVLFWLGLGSIAQALDRRGAALAGIGVLCVGLVPHILGWMTMVVKDSQLTACLIAISGIWAHHALAKRKVSASAIVAIAVLGAYAILVRHNAIFAIAPLVGSLTYRRDRGWWQPAMAAAVLACLLVFGLSGRIDRDLLGARHAYAENSLKLFDLAGIAHYAKLDTIYGISPADWKRSEEHACYGGDSWDPYNMAEIDGGCPWIYAPLKTADLTRPWLRAIAGHPVAYARHRLKHFNSTIRFWTSHRNWDAASAEVSDRPNPHGIGLGRALPYHLLVKAQSLLDRTPLGRPFAWYLAGAALFLMALRAPPGPVRQLALALLISSAMMLLSFLVVSVAPEFRYHHWALVAIGCAACCVYSLDIARKWRTALWVLAGTTVLFAASYLNFAIRFPDW